MLRTRHKRKNGESCDFPVFANSYNSTRRTKKSALQLVTKEVDALEISVGDDDEVINKKPHRRKRKNTSGEANDDCGEEYPMDVWFMISEFIAPEDVAKFSAICHACYKVCKSAKFWFSMYKRYYKPTSEIPEILQPSLMVRRYGLRALVIRSLHYTYQPFVAKCKAQFTIDSDIIKGRLCTEAWVKNGVKDAKWHYFFKLKECCNNNYGRRQNHWKPDLMQALDDIDANVDDGCKLLQVQSTRYFPLPMVTGETLKSFEMKISSDYRFYNVQMQFSRGLDNYEAKLVNLGNVVRVRMLDWWHPDYVHSDPMHAGLFRALLPESWDHLVDSDNETLP